MVKLVSVITPAFNSALVLEDCLLSVKRQGEGVEHIVIDGGSLDGTVDLLKKHEPDYQLKWISERDSGIAEATNKGFALAQGEIVAWLDADNYYQPGVIAEVVDIFNNRAVDIVYGNIEIVDWRGQLKNIYRPPSNISLAVAVQKNTGGIPPQPGVFFRKELLDTVGGFNVGYKVAGDVDFWMKILKINPRVFYHDRLIGSYRLDAAGTSRSLKGMGRGLKEMLKIYRQYNLSLLGQVMLIKKYVYGYLKTVIVNLKK